MNVKKNFLLLSIALIVLPLFFFNQTFLISIFSQVLIFSIAAFGLNILIGYAGQISIGHAAFLALGAYTSAVLTKNFNLPFLLTIILAAVVSAIFGLILGFPALRLKGFYLAIATMAFGTAVEQMLGAWDYIGGKVGFRNVPNPDLFGIEIRSDIGKYYIIVFFTVLLFVIGYNILQAKTGRALKAIRESEFAARSAGVDVAKYKLIAFIISAIYAGIAGALYAHTVRYIAPTDFGLGVSINLLAMIVVGGLVSISGNFIGATLMIGVPFFFSRVNIPMSIIFGVMLIIVVMFFPRGLGFGLYIFNWKYLSIPYTRFKKFIRKRKYENKSEKYLKIDDGRVHYIETENDGKYPVVFLHGNFASSTWYRPVIELLKTTDYKGVAVDLPGFGASSKPQREISIENYSRELKDIIEKLGFKKIDLVAHSLGGAVAYRFAMDNRDLVNRLLLIDPAPGDGLKTPEENYPLINSYKDNRGLLRVALSKMLYSGDPYKLLDEITDDALLMDERAFVQNARILEKYNYLEELKALDIPVLVLVGENDSLINEKILKKTVDALPRAEIKKVENVGHCINLENPELFVDILKKFLK